MTSTTRQIITAYTIAYVDADGNTVMVIDRATGRVIFRAA